MSFSGHELKLRNEQIVKCLSELKNQRNELNMLIEKQQEEKIKLQTEVQRITYKISLISKSLAQRITTRADYDKTIKQAEEDYFRLVESSGKLLNSVQGDVRHLEQVMDKKIGTNDFPEITPNIDNISLITTLSNKSKNETVTITQETTINEIDYEIE